MKIVLKILKCWFIFSTIFILPLVALSHEAEMPHDEPIEETADVAAISPAVLVIGVVIAVGIGGAVWFLMKKGKKIQSSQSAATQNSTDKIQ